MSSRSSVRETNPADALATPQVSGAPSRSSVIEPNPTPTRKDVSSDSNAKISNSSKPEEDISEVKHHRHRGCAAVNSQPAGGEVVKAKSWTGLQPRARHMRPRPAQQPIHALPLHMDMTPTPPSNAPAPPSTRSPSALQWKSHLGETRQQQPWVVG